MKRTFTASIWQEGGWYVAQCAEVDVAGQGGSQEEALANLREAHRAPIRATHGNADVFHTDIEVDVHAA